MKRLLIKNFGPIKEANLTLGQVNIITGMLSCNYTVYCRVIFSGKEEENVFPYYFFNISLDLHF